ncbi:putative ABC transport system permease protein [Nitrosomonas eutropha]|uniref:Putative ABC transport system permease protein n=1 Tax=Nitrosomonas eutropha TaxID=916 RepID=A0A1I7JEM8_9PROT|nr:ABC transporter permease [Nitrosomonas eutropha]SFU83646.1 putative ABC transport system permease protein [Nitrosomonas eutropha]
MFKLALRNIFRQKIHTLMTLAAVITGIAGIILAGGWVQDIYVQLGEALIHSQSGHLQVYRQGYFAAGSRSPEKFLMDSPDTLKQHITNNPEVKQVMARLNFSGLLNNGRSDLPIIGEGVEPELEAELGSSVRITAGRQLNDSDAFGILLGKGVAQALQLKPGDPVTLLVNTLDGALNSLDFQVTGIFQSFSNDFDARAIRIPLAAAQELLGTGGVNALVISLQHTEETDQVAAKLKQWLDSSRLEIKTWVELNDFYEKTVELYKGQFGVLQLIILVMVLLSVANSVNMSIFERVGEFGTMMALGNRSNQVFWLIISENLLLGLIGGGLGTCVGILLAMIISAIGIPMPPPPNADIGYIAHILIVPSVLLLALGTGFIATVLAAILPARHVSHVPVVDALRQNI